VVPREDWFRPSRPRTSSYLFAATYIGDTLRVRKNDTRNSTTQVHDLSRRPHRLLWESNPNTVYTPGFGHRSNGVNSFYQVDWLGSTRYVTSDNGNVWTAAQAYDAFGNRASQGQGSPNHPTDLQFASGWG
jgi:hypothetical protein